jgi:hypothetical protein
MDNYLQKGFYAKRATCNFRYNLSFFKDEINEDDITPLRSAQSNVAFSLKNPHTMGGLNEKRCKIDNLEKEIIYCKNDVDYIQKFIEYIKERVIKKCKNLSSVNIILTTFNKNNIIHKLMVVITNMVWNLLKIKEKIDLYKSIIVVVEYEGQMVLWEI